MARGVGKDSPRARQERLYALSSIAFIGLPCPMKSAGMRGVVGKSANAAFRLDMGESFDRKSKRGCGVRRGEMRSWKESSHGVGERRRIAPAAAAMKEDRRIVATGERHARLRADGAPSSHVSSGPSGTTPLGFSALIE